MLRIKKIDNLIKWNNCVLECKNYNIFSSFEWGEFKKNNWRVDRYAFYKNNNLAGLIQILIKEKGGFNFGWSSSGILFTDERFLSEIIDSLSQIYNYNQSVLRFNFYNNNDRELFLIDSFIRLRQVKKTINSGYTIKFNKKNLAEFSIEKLSPNHRYYYKKSLSENLIFEYTDLNVDEFFLLHNNMTKIKNIRNLRILKDELLKLKNSFNSNLKMGRVIKNNKVLSSCIILIFKKYAFYYSAASNKEGREKFASFFMVKNVIDKMKELNIDEFDFGGITPYRNDAKGVNRFKIGFGGKIVKYIGERNWAGSNLLNYIFNFIVSNKLN